MITQNFEPSTPSNLLQVIQVNKWVRKQERKSFKKKQAERKETVMQKKEQTSSQLLQLHQ